MATVADMTLEELKALIDSHFTKRFTELLNDESAQYPWDDIRRSVESHRWIPPADSRSSLEMLREDRDR